MKYIAILILVVALGGCTTIIKEIDCTSGTCIETESKYQRGDFAAKMQKEKAEIWVAAMNARRLEAENEPNRCGPSPDVPDNEAGRIVANAWANCMNRVSFGSIADAIAAATGNSLDPLAQVIRSDNALEGKRIEEDTKVKLANRSLAGTLFSAGLSTWAILAARDSSSGQSIGDGNTFNISNSSADDSALSGGEGTTSLTGAPSMRQISIFGDTGQGFVADSTRSGVSLGAPTLINDTSGTMNANSGTQKSNLISDQVNGDFASTDDDGFNL